MPGIWDIPMKYHAHIENISGGSDIPEDEPVFIIRAKDKLALRAVAAYIEIARAAGCIQVADDIEGDVVTIFETWQQENLDKMKLPD